jgi:hypothetical protein
VNFPFVAQVTLQERISTRQNLNISILIHLVSELLVLNRPAPTSAGKSMMLPSIEAKVPVPTVFIFTKFE